MSSRHRHRAVNLLRRCPNSLATWISAHPNAGISAESACRDSNWSSNRGRIGPNSRVSADDSPGIRLEAHVWTMQRCGGSTAKQKAPNYWASQKSGGLPIITTSALLQLAEWWETRLALAQGEGLCPDKDVRLPPPARSGKGECSAQATLDAASTAKTAADAANSGMRRGSADRTASRKGGGR